MYYDEVFPVVFKRMKCFQLFSSGLQRSIRFCLGVGVLDVVLCIICCARARQWIFFTVDSFESCSSKKGKIEMLTTQMTTLELVSIFRRARILMKFLSSMLPPVYH